MFSSAQVEQASFSCVASTTTFDGKELMESTTLDVVKSSDVSPGQLT